jgi:hypothetical protein
MSFQSKKPEPQLCRLATVAAGQDQRQQRQSFQTANDHSEPKDHLHAAAEISIGDGICRTHRGQGAGGRQRRYRKHQRRFQAQAKQRQKAVTTAIERQKA